MLESGFYYHLLATDKIRPEDLEPDTELFQFYIDAFHELSTCRVSGMDVGPIPFTAIVEYSRIFEVEDFDDFHYLIRKMDRTYLKLESDKNKKKAVGKTGDKK